MKAGSTRENGDVVRVSNGTQLHTLVPFNPLRNRQLLSDRFATVEIVELEARRGCLARQRGKGDPKEGSVIHLHGSRRLSTHL
eukprot:scaffold48_cov395-Prasinococcus_capsulatus_cf.AAC.40